MARRHAVAGSVALRLKSDRGISDTLPGQLTHDVRAASPNPGMMLSVYLPDVFCWCQREVLRSTWDRIAAGLTESCGRPGCQEPASP